MGQVCCAKDSSSTTETQVAYIQGPAEGTVVPVPKLKNPESSAQDELPVPQTTSPSDTYVNGAVRSSGNGRSFEASRDDHDYLEVPAPELAESDFTKIQGTWYFVANGKEAGTIGLDGFLTFHNGMTGQLAKAAGRSQAFTLTTQPEAIIEIVRGVEGEDHLHWTDGNFSAYWSRSKPQGFADFAGIWVRKEDGKNMVRINGNGLVEWAHDGGPVNPNGKKSNGHASEIKPGSVFQLQALQYRTPRGESTFTMKSVSNDMSFSVVTPNKTEMRFESSTLQGLVLIRK